MRAPRRRACARAARRSRSSAARRRPAAPAGRGRAHCRSAPRRARRHRGRPRRLRSRQTRAPHATAAPAQRVDRAVPAARAAARARGTRAPPRRRAATPPMFAARPRARSIAGTAADRRRRVLWEALLSLTVPRIGGWGIGEWRDRGLAKRGTRETWDGQAPSLELAKTLAPVPHSTFRIPHSAFPRSLTRPWLPP